MKRIYYNIPSLLILLAAATSCTSKTETESETPVEQVQESPSVQLTQVSRTTVDHNAVYTANVEAYKTNNISSSMPNRIKQILVEVGDNVAKGQKIAILDDVNIEQSRVRLENAEREYERALKLFEIGGGTRQSVDQLKTELDASRRAYANQLENTILVSPVAGTVTARNYDPGDMPGAQPIVTVSQINPVKIMVGVNELDFKAIKPGMPVKVELDAYPEETFEGKVSIVHPSIDPSTRTFLTELTVPNPGNRILPGMFARATVSLGQAEAVIIPDRALIKQPGSAVEYVYTFNPSDSTVAFTPVVTGQRIASENAYEVLEGLNDGAIVVLSGQSRLVNGAKASPIK